ncbi:MAG: fibronectin type III domain-containing protein, partial [Thermoguttaceae bacterium]|nr:fibronectin type III domain-containing protein [Thermoguttaceae bacterium]
STVQGATFAPFALASSVRYVQGERTISIGLSGSDNASANIRWYYVTEDGDVEIEEATGLLEYSPVDATYDVRIVATGTGDSEGMSLETTVLDTISLAYDAANEQATLTWAPVVDAENYRVMISVDGGESWSNYADELTETSVVVDEVVPGTSYAFMVASTGLSTVQGATFAPFALASSVRYVQGERTISLGLSGSDNASADVRWYYVTEDGDVEIEEAAGLLEYSPVHASYDVRIVATGTGDSEGMSLETIIDNSDDESPDDASYALLATAFAEFVDDEFGEEF